MDFFTSTILSGILYDGFKNGVAISSAFLKEKLQGWLVDDVVLEQIAKKVHELELQDFGERVIERKLNESSELQELIKLVKPEQNIGIGSVTQNHCGSGDNIVGNKTVHNK
ncbi:hypothetical protein [uncultured Vibrio sp.]|uniref:GapS6a family protein n=1 Tax=uncultured Vibrio sp. TaxID=114054 RepID=UPI00260D0C8C|nr:hypothetical protein [uncultured Vibrio sp.]